MASTYIVDPVWGIPLEKRELFLEEKKFITSKGDEKSYYASTNRKEGENLSRAVNSFNYDITPEDLQTHGKKTFRFEENITSLRACYCDIDVRKEGDDMTKEKREALKEQMKEELFLLPCPPTFIVITKNGIHGWWVIEGLCGLPLYKRINEGIAKSLKYTDDIKDAARVLRAPGSIHAKSEEKFICIMVPSAHPKQYTQEDLMKAFEVKTKVDSKVSGDFTHSNPTVDIINNIPVEEVVSVIWPELSLDRNDKCKFFSSELNREIAMFKDRKGRNIVHPGGGEWVKRSCGPFLLVKDEYGLPDGKVIEWFCEMWDIVPRMTPYPWKLSADLVDSCWYGNVDDSPSVLFCSKGKWGAVPIKERVILQANFNAMLDEMGHSALIGPTGGSKKELKLEKWSDCRSYTMEKMCSRAVRGETINREVRVAGTPERIILGDIAGYYEITPGKVERKEWAGLKILMQTKCENYGADLSVDVKGLEKIVPLMSTFKNGEKGGRFLAAYSVVAMIPDIQVPPFLFLGEPSTAKTSKMRAVASIVDPHPTLDILTVDSRDQRNLIANAANSWLICLDNKGNFTADESDRICTLFSGGIISERSLYTNNSISQQQIKRPCLISAIEAPKNMKVDLWDRFVALESALSQERAYSESEFQQRLKACLPEVRGSALNLISRIIGKNLQLSDDIKRLVRRKRDFAKYMYFVYKEMGWDEDELTNILTESSGFVSESRDNTDPLLTCLLMVVEKLINSSELKGDAVFNAFSEAVQDGRVVVEGNEIKISTNMLLELLRLQARMLSLHHAELGSIPTNVHALSRAVTMQMGQLKDRGIEADLYNHQGQWRGWRFVSNQGE
jgi:hypothetical protein